MRRLLLALTLGLVAAPSYAGDMYYRTQNSFDIKAVPVTGGTPRVVLRSTEYKVGYIYGMTRYNHVGSNGQALLQSYPLDGSSPVNLQLIYRAPSGMVVTKPVTNLGSN